MIARERSGHDVFLTIITEYYCKERKKNYENFRQKCEAPEQDLNSGLLKYETVVTDTESWRLDSPTQNS